jgi:hypothetical protein
MGNITGYIFSLCFYLASENYCLKQVICFGWLVEPYDCLFRLVHCDLLLLILICDILYCCVFGNSVSGLSLLYNRKMVDPYPTQRSHCTPHQYEGNPPPPFSLSWLLLRNQGTAQNWMRRHFRSAYNSLIGPAARAELRPVVERRTIGSGETVYCVALETRVTSPRPALLLSRSARCSCFVSPRGALTAA